MGKRAWISILLIIVLLAGIVTSFFLLNVKVTSSTVSTAGRIAAYTKPAVVRVVDGAIIQWDYSYIFNANIYNYMAERNGQTSIAAYGSGAIISENGYIVTNAHVVDLTRKSDEEIATEALATMATEISQLYSYDVNEVYDYLVTLLGYQSVQRVQKVYLPNGESYDSDLKAFGAPIGEGKDVAVLKIDGKNLPTLQLGASDAVQLQDDIWVIGYPAAADMSRYGVLSEESQLVSTINAGQVSAKDKKSTQGSPVIQISAPTGPGNSGGPIVNKNGEIIGLLTFGDPTKQGFNFAVPSSTVQEFIAQSGAKTAPSAVDTLYKEGLEFFWSGYYDEALDRFQKVQQLYANHSEIKQLISDTQAKVGDSKIYWPKYTTYFYIYVGIAAVIIIFLVIFTFVLKPKKTETVASSHIDKKETDM